MIRPVPIPGRSLAVAAMLLALAAAPHSAAQSPPGYDRLVALFGEWRAFQQPRVVNGVPDYSAAAMAAQRRALPAFQQRLAAIDPSPWPVPEQIDWHLVRAEMNGLDFDQRVLKPWANNPNFYVTVFPSRSDQPAREGHYASGGVEIWSYRFPLSDADAAKMASGIRAIPGLLEQAKANLTGAGRDLWTFGVRGIRRQGDALARLAERAAGAPGTLAEDIARAKAATDAFASWLETRAAAKTGPSGIGVEHYDWYLRHVQVVPYSWRDQVTLMERELGRAVAFLALEEKRNATLPAQAPIASAEEHERRFRDAITEYMTFLAERDILTVTPWMDPALRAQVGRYTAGPREFFAEVDYRDPEIMRTHGYHWFDLARMEQEPHASPIRRGPLLYNIFITRTEGLATGWEEMMLQAGMFDARPRSRELIYILLAQRAARALGDLRMHANEWSLEEAATFAAAHTPRGWLRLDANTVWGEQHLYLQQPTYGTSYLVGKMQIERIMAERRRQLGDAFSVRRFMDELDGAGLIPASLIDWQLTGRRPVGLN
jgi:hypothetical protein